MRLGSSEIRGCSGHEAGRKLLEALYREETGEALPNILLSVRGKPFFENSPYHFSISHTDRHAFCALSRRPVGIDAEELDRAVRFSLVAKCTGAGLTGFPNRTDFSPDDSRVFTWRGCLVAVIGQENETERRILHDF